MRMRNYIILLERFRALKSKVRNFETLIRDPKPLNWNLLNESSNNDFLDIICAIIDFRI